MTGGMCAAQRGSQGRNAIRRGAMKSSSIYAPTYHVMSRRASKGTLGGSTIMFRCFGKSRLENDGGGH
eukprot:9498478-Pyramimonas_sp.AAC.1